MAEDVAMDDLDIDFMDDDDPEIAKMKAASAEMQKQHEQNNAEAMNGVEEAPEEGEVTSSAVVPEKVHVRGLNNLNTNEVMQFAEEHYSMSDFVKVQWVNDTSANLVYSSELAASEALAAFSAEEVSDPLESRQAKRLSTKPDIDLQVRQSINSDIKVANASVQSQFYLFNPAWDPEIRKRKRRQFDNGASRSYSKYARRDETDDNAHRRTSRDQDFTEDMYDDKPASSEIRKDSYASDGEYRRRGRNRGGEDLMAGRSNGRLRNRSASPLREGDGKYGFADEQPHRRTARARSRTPPGARNGRDNRDARENKRKELFPDRNPRATSSYLTNGYRRGNVEDDYRPSSSNGPASRELFPDKLANTIHRRQDAKNLRPDEVADAISRQPRNERGGSGGRDLFERINDGSSRSVLSQGYTNEEEFRFKGMDQQKDPGFSFLGASREAKELFPMKGGSNGAGGGGGVTFKGRGRKVAQDS